MGRPKRAVVAPMGGVRCRKQGRAGAEPRAEGLSGELARVKGGATQITRGLHRSAMAVQGSGET
jgi:hypothetical protein